MPQSRLSRMESGERRIDVIELAEIAQLYRKPLRLLCATCDPVIHLPRLLRSAYPLQHVCDMAPKRSRKSQGRRTVTQKNKDPLAVELGRRGGLKGGKARAANMTPEERSESARKAVMARWAKRQRERGS